MMAKPGHSKIDFLEIGRRTIACEQEGLIDLRERLDDRFVSACELFQACEGHIVVTGIGKSGHIGRKIAATFSSTGSPALFLHPAEAGHGDMGAVKRADVILAISYSGEAPELLTLVPLWKRLGSASVAMTGNMESTLARACDVCLDVSVKQEACPLDLAPTTSTTACLALGDALAIALLEVRGFDSHDFAFSHPSGTLGRRLLTTVGDVMKKGKDMPQVDGALSVADALIEMNRCGLGMTVVVDGRKRMRGVFTDGDLRRALNQRIDVHTQTVATFMTPGGYRAKAEQLAVDALNMMQQHKITALVCVDERDCPQGVVHMHDLLRSGLL